MDDARIDTLIRQIAALTVALQSSSRAPRASIPIPSDRAWFDPVLLWSHTDTRVTLVSGDFTGASVIAGANPNRVCVGFTHSALSGSTWNLSPHQYPFEFPLRALSLGESVWYTLHDYPNLVQREWYAVGSGDDIVLVTEVIRLSRSK